MFEGAHETNPRIGVLEFPEALKPFVRDTSRSGLVQLVDVLHAEIVTRVFSKIDEASDMAKAIRVIALHLDDEYCRAVADRAAGHVAYATADYVGALAFYEAAVMRFESLGRDDDVARTLNGALQTLIYLDRFDQARRWAERARTIFARSGDRLRIARLDSNLGNLLYRQDRYEEARQLYKRAYEQFRILGETRDIAAALSNLSVSAISLGEFGAALEEYLTARTWCATHQMPRLVAEADYNIAYLHFLRGDYLRAIDLYRKARAYSKRVGDAYHAALCDLDQSEVYLDLNLLSEGLQLADRAAQGFCRLKLNYEHAKALTFVAIAYGRRRQNAHALRLFSRARRAITGPQNPVWPAVIDLYRAACLRDLGLSNAALRVNRRARRAFASERLRARVAKSDLLTSRLYFESGQPEEGLDRINRVLRSIDPQNTPVVFFEGLVLKGQIETAVGSFAEAESTLRQAIERLETLRTRLIGDELSIAFLQDKVHVYEMLIDLIQSGPGARSRARETFDLMERSKSRTLAEWMTRVHRNLSPQARPATDEQTVLRQDLNAQYRRLEEMLTSPALHDRRAAHVLHKKARDLEIRLTQLLVEQQAGAGEARVFCEDAAASLECIQDSLPADCVIVEYYVTAAAIFVAVIGKNVFHLERLGCLSDVKHSIDLLRFHFCRARSHGSAYSATAAQQRHLAELYDHLVRPIRRLIRASHLVIIPHGPLHQLPFHALLDQDRFLIDDFIVSYAPSANVFYSCSKRLPNKRNLSLVMGVPDRKAPHIEQEVQTVADLLPNAIRCLGAAATETVLRRHASESRYIHIASHSRFRADNPMFSSIQLGDSKLSVFDLNQIAIGSELVTLSGCSTGVNGVLRGDELVGMVRGFLRAGARRIMMTLWDVHDQSTAEFMKLFYKRLADGASVAHALRSAMIEVRRQYPSPYFWAPFAVSGAAAPDR